MHRGARGRSPMPVSKYTNHIESKPRQNLKHGNPGRHRKWQKALARSGGPRSALNQVGCGGGEAVFPPKQARFSSDAEVAFGPIAALISHKPPALVTKRYPSTSGCSSTFSSHAADQNLLIESILNEFNLQTSPKLKLAFLDSCGCQTSNQSFCIDFLTPPRARCTIPITCKREAQIQELDCSPVFSREDIGLFRRSKLYDRVLSRVRDGSPI